MADYPTSIPSLTRVGNGIVGGADDPAADGSDTDAVVVVTALQEELEAVATELGTSPSGGAATVGARIGDVEGDVAALTTDVAGKEDAGVAATLVDAHAGATDPHQDRQYTDDSIASLDATLVHLSGDESVDGVKTFLDPPVSITPATLANELVSKAVMDAAISAAVNALVDGAPGALDTLNELAAALGDDAAFQSTVTTALAGKASKASNLSDLANIATARTNLGLGTAAVLNVGTTTGTVMAGDDARWQPLDSDLTAIAALTTTSFGRSLLALADAAALTALGNAVVGDSGSGGTKGLVPAPSAGDAAAGKFLKADGTFAVPAGGGSVDVREEGSSLTAAATRLDFVGLGTYLTEPVADQIRVNASPQMPLPPSQMGSKLYSPQLFGYTDDGTTYERMYLIPFYAHDFGVGDIYISNVRVYCSTANASGVARVGLYDPSDGFQLDLVTNGDMGTIALSSTGDKVKNVASGSRPKLVFGDWNYIAVVVQGSSAAKLTVSTVAPVSGQMSTLTGTFVKTTQGYFEDAVTGALPAITYAPFAGAAQRVAQVPSVLLTLSTTA